MDAALGIDTQALKLLDVCRLRDLPSITFVNEMYREARDPFELPYEVERKLALDVVPAS